MDSIFDLQYMKHMQIRSNIHYSYKKHNWTRTNIDPKGICKS